MLSGLSEVIVGTFFNSTDSSSVPAIIAADMHHHVQEDLDGVFKYEKDFKESRNEEENNRLNKNKRDEKTSNVKFNAPTPIIQEKVIVEKIYVEPPTPSEIASVLTESQLKEIADNIKNSFGKEEIDMEGLTLKILQTSHIQNIINNYNSIVSSGKKEKEEILNEADVKYEETLRNYDNVIGNLQAEIEKLKREMISLEKGRKASALDILNRVHKENLKITTKLKYDLNRCCRNSFIHVENYVSNILRDLLGIPGEYKIVQGDVSNWLHTIFVAKQDLEDHIKNATKNLRSDFNQLIQDNGKVLMDEISGRISLEINKEMLKVNRKESEVLSVSSDEHIRNIVEEVLSKYDADKTGLVDYAMEPSGGQILSTRCTESYQAGTAVVSIMGIPLWYLSNSPRTIITPGINPGECWAFQNFPGFVIIKLSGPVKIEAFSYEHISKNLVPSGRIDSAPKEFQVLGIKDENDKEPVLIGEYVYDSNGKPLQYFAAQRHGLTFNIIELRVISNHGNPNYTCLYRFRVHGSLNVGGI